MKTALLVAAVVAALAPLAEAQKYVVRNGRGAVGGGGGGGGHSAPRSAGAPSRQSSGGAAPVYSDPGAGMAVARRASGGSGHRSFIGGGARLGRNIYRVPQRGVDAGGGGAPPAEAPEEAPPHFSKPGALIRTEGHRQFQFTEAGNHREHTIEAGEIKLDPRKASHVNRSPGVRQGAPDKLPPCTPGSSGCSGGGNAITPNSPAASSGGALAAAEPDAPGSGWGSGTGFEPSF